MIRCRYETCRNAGSSAAGMDKPEPGSRHVETLGIQAGAVTAPMGTVAIIASMEPKAHRAAATITGTDSRRLRTSSTQSARVHSRQASGAWTANEEAAGKDPQRDRTPACEIAAPATRSSDRDLAAVHANGAGTRAGTVRGC